MREQPEGISKRIRVDICCVDVWLARTCMHAHCLPSLSTGEAAQQRKFRQHTKWFEGLYLCLLLLLGHLGGHKHFGHRVPPVVGLLGEIADTVEAARHVDEALSRSILDVAAIVGATRAGNRRAELVVGLGPFGGGERVGAREGWGWNWLRCEALNNFGSKMP